jgi:hypothetical protein
LQPAADGCRSRPVRGAHPVSSTRFFDAGALAGPERRLEPVCLATIYFPDRREAIVAAASERLKGGYGRLCRQEFRYGTAWPCCRRSRSELTTRIVVERGTPVAASSVRDSRDLKMRGYAAVDAGHPSTDGLLDRGPLIWKLSS